MSAIETSSESMNGVRPSFLQCLADRKSCGSGDACGMAVRTTAKLDKRASNAFLRGRNPIAIRRTRIGHHIVPDTPRINNSGRSGSIAASLVKHMVLGMLAVCCGVGRAYAASETVNKFNSSSAMVANQGETRTAIDLKPGASLRPASVNFGRENAALDVRQLAARVIESGDNDAMPFVIVDKKRARVFVFSAGGQLSGAAAALLGLARGDDSVPGIGKQALSSIRPEERTTPAGRFVASLGRNLRNEEVLWVDYDAAISMHRVLTSNPKEHRARRLATPTPLDNRITYGCINVPVSFYEHVVSPAFTGTNGIVYILPETQSMQKVFASSTFDEREKTRTKRGRALVQSASIPTVERTEY